MSGGLVLLTLMLWNLRLARWEGGVLVGTMVVAIFLLLWWARGDARAGRIPGGHHGEPWSGSKGREALVGAATLGLTLLGADLLVRGATRLADDVGISSAFVGLVIVSLGTSLPELATALAAARRAEPDLVLGNVLGSNLFNSLAVAGTAGLVGPGVVDGAFRDALGFMLLAGVLAGTFALTGRRVERWEGAVLLAVFLGFVALVA